MKKLLGVLAILAMIALCACGGKEEKVDEEEAVNDILEQVDEALNDETEEVATEVDTVEVEADEEAPPVEGTETEQYRAILLDVQDVLKGD